MRRSKDMDHIVPVREAPERVYDPENLQALCRPSREQTARLFMNGKRRWKTASPIPRGRNGTR